MEELESQIAKIQLGNFKHTNSYVYIAAEKAAGSDAELYVVAELPLLNPAAESSCEKICLAIASTLKRAYKRPVGENYFENAITLINEELGKLASLGQTHWIDKLNCIIAVKEGRNLTVASTGKVVAYLLRNREFADISCSNPSSHVLKTFENYATGKIKLDDLLIFSTTQLFNHISVDRLKSILTGTDFLTATQTVIEILKENAGPEVAFGTLFNLQVLPGQTAEEEVDLENYILEKPAGQPNRLVKTFNFVRDIFVGGSTKRVPKVNLPKVSFTQHLKNLGGGTLNKSRGAWNTVARGITAGKNTFSLKSFKEFSPQKKFFFAAAAFLFVAVIFSVYAAVSIRHNRTNQEQVSLRLKEAQTLLANAQSSLLYNDQAATINYLTDAKARLTSVSNLNDSNKQLFDKLTSEVKDVEQKIDKLAEVKVENLGSLGQADRLIKLPGFIAVQVNNQIVSYSINSGKMEDGTLKSSDDIKASIFVGNNLAAVHNGRGLLLWDYTSGKNGTPFFQSVPEIDDLAGLAYYATNNRVYAVDKKSGQIINFLISNNTFAKPIVAVRDAELNQAVDMAIDGSIYVLTSTGINKYQSGKPVDFKMPSLTTPLSGSGKIYTSKDSQNIYILDSGNNRILVITKKGALSATLKSSGFTKLKDFSVDEKTKTIYVLNDGSLLKVSY